MSRKNDYRDDMSNTEFVDQDIEALITGKPSSNQALAELTHFVETLRSFRTIVPSVDASEQVVATAVATVRSGQLGLADSVPGGFTESPDRRPSWRPARAAFAFAGFALLVTAVMLGVVAHTSIPGDSLYGVDLALEQVGIGNGSVDERLQEVDQLIDAGDQVEALVLLGRTFERVAASNDVVAAQRVERSLATVGTIPSGATSQLATRVDLIRKFIEKNAGPGIGLDGAEFDRALQDIARQEP